jgi:hypothetical protein
MSLQRRDHLGDLGFTPNKAGDLRFQVPRIRVDSP